MKNTAMKMNSYTVDDTMYSSTACACSFSCVNIAKAVAALANFVFGVFFYISNIIIFIVVRLIYDKTIYKCR